MSDIVLYTTEDGVTRLDLRVEGETVWLNQADIAELFDKARSTVAEHIQNILSEGELEEDSVCRNFRQTAQDGKDYKVLHYNLDMILAIGYRVRSPRGTQFRRWATTTLKEYLVKGFVMDDERLKETGGWDYFDELLERIRDIRASEKRFYQKVRDLFALSSDYQQREEDTQLFFAQAQNKLLYAVTEYTAAELIVERANPNEPNMSLTSWKGARVRKQDVIIAKNYLTADEIDTLNRLVVMFLDQAELRVQQQQDLTLSYWQNNIDKMLEFNEQKILQGAGSVSHDDMKCIVETRYDEFDEKRRKANAKNADDEDLNALESLAKELNDKKR